MKVEFMNPFIDAAKTVIETEIQSEIQRGAMTLLTSPSTTRDVTAIVAVTGKIQGIVLYGMSRETALAMVSAMMGQEFAELDDLAISGIAEMGNVITGTAGVALEKSGYPSKLAPPVVIIGNGTKISTLDIQRLIVPLSTKFGDVEVQIAIKETPTNGVQR